MRRPEQGIRIGIREFLKTIGFAVWDLEQNRPTRQTPGFPDLVAIGKGRVLFIEVKTPSGRLSVHQELFQTIARENGQTYVVWRSVGEARDWLLREKIIRETAA